MNFKEWFKRIDEGVSIGVDMPEDKRKKDAPETVNDLIYAIQWSLNNFAHTLPKKHPELDLRVYDTHMMPDGDDFDKSEGIINFYTDKKWDPDQTKQILNQAQKEMEKEGATVGAITSNTFKDKFGSSPDANTRKWMKEKGATPEDVRVYRIPVKLDPEAAKDNMPAVNMGFQTAEKVLSDIFGIASAGADPVKSLTGEGPSGDWNGYQFTADQIIKTFERLVAPAGARAFMKDTSGKGREMPYKEFLEKYINLPVAAELESEGNAKFGGLALPAGIYNLYRKDGVSVAATPPNDDLEREARLASTPSKTLKKGDKVELPSEDEFGIAQDRPYKDTETYEGPTIYSGGTSANLILQRAQEIYKLALWAKKHGFDKMYGV